MIKAGSIVLSVASALLAAILLILFISIYINKEFYTKKEKRRYILLFIFIGIPVIIVLIGVSTIGAYQLSKLGGYTT